jgi:hypothetical protein
MRFPCYHIAPKFTSQQMRLSLQFRLLILLKCLLWIQLLVILPLFSRVAVTVVITGFHTCPFFQNSTVLARSALYSNQIEVRDFETKEEYLIWLKLEDDEKPNIDAAKRHVTSPFIYEKETRLYIG